LTNEVHFSVDKAPFSLTAGKVTTANHQTYDMASPDDKRRMMDENLVYWIDQQRAAILEVDPTALVTVSFPAINSGQTTVHTGPAIWESTADFIDLHAYLGWGLSLEDYVNRFEMQGYAEKPIILGEFGAAKRAYPSAAVAAQALQEMQVDSCGYGFDGWLLWTWDGDEQTELWNGLSENGEISAALAPRERPDPCLQ
jgi:endo-1,4-beta-mannosidase